MRSPMRQRPYEAALLIDLTKHNAIADRYESRTQIRLPHTKKLATSPRTYLQKLPPLIFYNRRLARSTGKVFKKIKRIGYDC